MESWLLFPFVLVCLLVLPSSLPGRRAPLSASAAAQPAKTSAEPAEGPRSTSQSSEPPKLAPSGRVSVGDREPLDFSQLAGYQAPGGGRKRLLILPIEGPIDIGLAALVDRSLRHVDDDTVVLLEVSTFGGRVDAAVEIRDRILALEVPTIAYVEHRAISAGALISLAADTLILDTTASMGAVTPVQVDGPGPPKPTSEKVVSYMRAEMRATAEATGRRSDLAEAMVDADIEVEGVSEKGKLLTLTARDAASLGLADGVVGSLDELLQAMGLDEAERVEPQSDWGERLASFLTDPAVSSLLMSLGMLGLMVEFYSPGFGWGGALGLLCLALFFGGHWAAHLAGWEEVLLLCGGLGLLALEVLVIPGFGVAGVLGLLMVAASLLMAMIRVDLPVRVAYDLGYLQSALSSAVVRLGVGMGLVVVLSLVLARYLPRATSRSFLVFQPDPPAAAPEGATSKAGSPAAGSPGPRAGDTGVALTILRPAGIAEFGGRRTHVVSEGPVVEPGVAVRIVSVEGSHVVVAVA